MKDKVHFSGAKRIWSAAHPFINVATVETSSWDCSFGIGAHMHASL